MRPRVTPATVVLAASLGVLVAAPLLYVVTRPAPTVGDRGEIRTTAPLARAEASPTSPPSNASAPSPDRAPARPVRLTIDALGADVPVVPVGVAEDGQVALPASGWRLGWYRYGTRPGEDQGSAVVVGHRDTVAEGRGALFDLPVVGVGDRIRVELADGSTLTYRVVARESLLKQRLPLEELFSRAGPPRLTIITCGGAYLPEVGGYQENVVVTAVPAARA